MHTVIVDANQQRKPNIPAFIPVLKKASAVRIIGVNQHLIAWRECLQSHAGARFIAPKSSHKHATTARLILEVTKEAERVDPGKSSFLIVGANRAYLELEAELLQAGHDVEIWPYICEDRATAYLQGSLSTCIKVRGFYRQSAGSRRSIGVGEFANELVNHIPEIKSPKKRREIFGTSKFKTILKFAGLNVQSGRVVGEVM